MTYRDSTLDAAAVTRQPARRRPRCSAEQNRQEILRAATAEFERLSCLSRSCPYRAQPRQQRVHWDDIDTPAKLLPFVQTKSF